MIGLRSHSMHLDTEISACLLPEHWLAELNVTRSLSASEGINRVCSRGGGRVEEGWLTQPGGGGGRAAWRRR